MLCSVCKIKNGKSNGNGFFIKIIDKKIIIGKLVF